MQANQVGCLLSTTDVPPKRINTLTEGLDINTVRINILGSEFKTGADQYFKLMNNMTIKVSQCLQ
jgi:zinc transport system substrate-binding protein